MIIFGIRETLLNSTLAENCDCPSCGQTNTLEVGLFGEYFHVYYVPLFPTGKRPRAICSQCETVFKGNTFPQGAVRTWQNQKMEYRNPIWMLSGLGILVVLIAVLVSVNLMNSRKSNAYVSNPKLGDTYAFSTSVLKGYSRMRIVKLSADSVYFRHNEFENVPHEKLGLIDLPWNYTGKMSAFSRKGLYEKWKSGAFFSINRPDYPFTE